MMRTLPIWMSVIIGCTITTAGAVETIESTGKVDSVTVYRGQAYVTRLVDVPGPSGLREVVVTQLPEHVVPGSIFAESADGIEVRSVRYRIRPVQQDVREDVRKLDEQIRAMQDQIDAACRKAELLTGHRTYLDKLEHFVAPTASAELTKGVLNAETVKNLTGFLFEERGRIAEEGLRNEREARALRERQDVLRRERETLTGTSARTVREALVFINVAQDSGGRLRLRYLVDHATWRPSYTIRAGDDGRKILVDYYASIQQMSGEDWSDVDMTLSTATPSLVAKAPALTPLKIALAGPGQSAEPMMRPGEFKQAQQELKKRKGQAARDRATRQRGQHFQQQQLRAQDEMQVVSGTPQDWDYMLNSLALEEQVLDLVVRGKVSRRDRAGPVRADEGVSVSYHLASRTALPSRSDRQLIQIASLPLPSRFYKIAVPVLTDYVYEEASVTNDSDLVLLAGSVSTYAAGQFVGHGDLPTVAPGEGFTVGFGIDPSLRASRELVEKSESIQGGNRVVKFTYRLGVENFGAESADVRLLDRLPQAKHREVNLELISPGVELSTDSSDVQKDRKRGILRWEVEVPAQAIDTELLAVEYQFALEYDRQKTIVALADAGN